MFPAQSLATAIRLQSVPTGGCLFAFTTMVNAVLASESLSLPMTNSRLFDFIRSRPAILVAAALATIFVFGLAQALRPRRTNSMTPLFTNSPPGETTTNTGDPGPPVTSPPKATPIQVKTNLPFTGLSIHTPVVADTNPPPLGVYAPAGRSLHGVLVNTVDSANIDTPIIALITYDLWHNGRLVIPAGSEIHGKASVDRVRERIISSGPWTIVWQTGEELVVNGIALDREENSSGSKWGITDGSAGLKGQIIRSDSFAEIKGFVAAFLSAAAAGLQENRNTVFGSQVANTGRNAALAGTSQVINTYAQQIFETIRREGIFVRVPAGKQMYLYITQTIDLQQAKIGNLRVTAVPNSAFSQTPATIHKP